MQQLHGPSVLPRDGGVEQIVVLLHGVGADGHDLIDLAPMLQPMLPRTAFYAPDAPVLVEGTQTLHGSIAAEFVTVKGDALVTLAPAVGDVCPLE